MKYKILILVGGMLFSFMALDRSVNAGSSLGSADLAHLSGLTRVHRYQTVSFHHGGRNIEVVVTEIHPDSEKKIRVDVAWYEEDSSGKLVKCVEEFQDLRQFEHPKSNSERFSVDSGSIGEIARSVKKPRPSLKHTSADIEQRFLADQLGAEEELYTDFPRWKTSLDDQLTRYLGFLVIADGIDDFALKHQTRDYLLEMIELLKNEQKHQ